MNNEEIYLFIKELDRLFEDYKKCKNRSIKDEIYKDILLLSDAVSQNLN